MSAKAPTTWRIGDDFNKVMPYHAGIEALWNEKWKLPCSKSLYPFHDGLYSDFEPVFEHLIKNSINNPLLPAYTEAFIPPAIALHDHALLEPNLTTRTTLLLRACTLLRISRFPYLSTHIGLSPSHTQAWTFQKQYYLLATSTWSSPVTELHLPFPSHTPSESASIPVYFRLPESISPAEKVPIMILITGLDGYRPDNTARLQAFHSRGWASLTLEIPGTADCPANPFDPTSPDRLFSDILDWIASHPHLDEQQVLAWGLSAGGYYAIRLAHMEEARIKAVVAQGAGVHHFFGREWCKGVEGHEYPFNILPSLALKHGYTSTEAYLASAQDKFSLLTNGILDMPCTQLLLINGTHDGLMPIEDSLLVLERGVTAKSAYFVEGRGHMGYPEANGVVYGWLDGLVGR